MGFSDRMQSRWSSRTAQRQLAVGGGGGPLTVLSEVFVERSAQAIWDAGQSHAARMQISPSITKIERVEGTGPGVGRQTTSLQRDGDDVHLVISEVLDEHPPTYQELQTTSVGIIGHVRRTWIEHTGAGCRLRVQIVVDLPPACTPEQRAGYDQALHTRLDIEGRRWKQLLETGHVDPPAEGTH